MDKDMNFIWLHVANVLGLEMDKLQKDFEPLNAVSQETSAYVTHVHLDAKI
jgi:pyrroloquinoline quinone (PQQ) biosynthesis protein C